MARTKKIKDGINVTIKISKEQLLQIEKMCWHMSKEQRKTITKGDAIRLALETVYPCQKQLDLPISKS